MRDPIYKHRRIGPAAAEFDQHCGRINDFIVMTEANSNVYLIETAEGGILLNTGMGFETPVVHHNLRKFSQIPIKFIITTQGHVDHVGGVQYFRNLYPDLKYIATAGNDEHQTYDGRLQKFRAARSAFRFQDDFIKVFKGYAEAGYTAINPQDRPVPDITFKDQYTFSLGGLEVVLIAAPGAETNDSLVVWLPQHKIVFTGNLFGCPFGHFPNLVTIRGDRYRDALTCAAAAQTVLDLNADLLLYGHHEPVAGAELIRAEVTAYRDAILHVHDEVVKGMNEGKDLYTLQQDNNPAAGVRGRPGLWQGELGYSCHLGELRWLVQTRIHHRTLQRAAKGRARRSGGAGWSRQPGRPRQTKIIGRAE